MAKRLTDTEIWDEDWFIDLPMDYKLLFLYVKDKCDYAGFWRVNRKKFQQLVTNKMIYLDDFLLAVNKDLESETPKNRIVVSDSGRWLITRFIPFQYGPKFKMSVGTHRGLVKLLLTNGIHPKLIPDFDWCGIENYDIEALKEIAYVKGIYSLYVGNAVPFNRLLDKDKDPDKDIRKGKEGPGENPQTPVFALQSIYDTPWNQVDTRKREFKGINEEQFCYWKKFVDWIIENGHQELFRAIFVTPGDFATLVSKHAFTEDKWEPVVGKLLSTGIQPQQNLYFRIPDFMKYSKTLKTSAESNMSAGDSNFGTMKQW